MKKIIDRKIYDTETAELIGEYCTPGVGTNDFIYVYEGLYKTKKGTYFIFGEGGALSKYKKQLSNGSTWGDNLEIVSKERAINFLEYHNLIEALEREFGDEIEEG